MGTTISHRLRLRSAALLAVLALVAGLSTACSTTALSPAGQGVAEAAATHGHGSSDNGNSGKITAAQLELRLAMRSLWAQHMEWTRLAVADFASGSAGFATTAGRLLQNQTDIGNAIKPFYGEAAGNQLATLLKTHITGFVALFQAAKAGDQAALASATTAVYGNAQDIADFLAAANP
ncbi:hypothetical protein ACQCSX_11895 [Pseudarthrobacter sp. P1]|uniref:hypothetical protein n=1 Tax=Pseudarthrobacter sp. P1 TaxID=3418418 RepID=UPI003CF2797C